LYPANGTFDAKFGLIYRKFLQINVTTKRLSSRVPYNLVMKIKQPLIKQILIATVIAVPALAALNYILTLDGKLSAAREYLDASIQSGRNPGC
jgi:threonine/homoserine efflux transporter RhtA